jgi:hypothetical protein
MVRAMRRLLVLLAPLTLGCATATPRFSQELATAFAQDDMRRLETADLELYYPAAHREAAELIARRATECLRRFRELQRAERPRERALLFLTSAAFNNAYVTGQAIGEPLHSVNPLQTSIELLHWYGLPGAGPADVSCHEMFHYAHFEQVEVFWRLVNAVTGPTVSAQLFLERWFTEGVAQYYEGRISRPVGRPNSPIYRGVFDSFVDARGGTLHPGDLSQHQRELSPWNGAYLTSLAFIEWLVKRSGEEALWTLMDKQGRDFFAPFGVSLRFQAVYDRALGDLVSEWSRELSRTHVARVRPKEQVVLRPSLGQLARVAVHGPTGAIALVHSGNEQVPMLRVLEADGAVRFEQRLTRVLPGRQWVAVGPVAMSGLSFTADGRFLFLMNEDLISRGDTRSQLWKIDAATGDVVQVWQAVARGLGGAVRPDGRAYVFVEFDAGRSRLASFELESAAITPLYEPPPGVALSSPAVAPDGARVVFSQMDGNGWNLRLREADGTVRALTSDGAFNYGARWMDGEHLSLTRTHEGRLQVHRLSLATGRLERLTDAPWTMLDAWPTRDALVFANRDGTQWTLDRAPLAVLQVVNEGRATAQADVPGAAEPPATDATATDAAPPPAMTPPPFQSSPPLTVTSDEPYSSLDHLFVPQLRLPMVTVLPVVNSDQTITLFTTLHASLSGRDRLSRHNWALNGSFRFPDRAWSASLDYVNMQLAPWQLGLSASRDGVSDGAFWSASLGGSRSFFTVPVGFAARALVSETYAPGGPSFFEKYFGPEVSIAFQGTESTAYGGPQRQFSTSAVARAYPAMFGSDRNVFDLRATLGFAVPLPFTQRHSFAVGLVGRWLPGSPANALRLGGQPLGLATLFQSQRTVDPPAGPGGYLPGSLAEGVRGYDDYTIRTEGAGIGTARYRFSFIIDRGTASILWLFPSFFARQVDVEVFGAGALTAQGQWMRSAGGAAIFRFTLMDVLPVSLAYQYAWRFDFGRGGLHTVSLLLE